MGNRSPLDDVAYEEVNIRLKNLSESGMQSSDVLTGSASDMNKTIILWAMLSLVVAPLFVFADNLQTPLEVVNKRMEAHNSHDLGRFLSVYSDDIQIYDYPDVPIGKKGKAHIKSIFAPLFEDKAVTVKIHHQIEHGKYVVNHETVVRQDKVTKYVSIYEVDHGLIRSVRFLRDY